VHGDWLFYTMAPFFHQREKFRTAVDAQFGVCAGSVGFFRSGGDAHHPCDLGRGVSLDDEFHEPLFLPGQFGEKDNIALRVFFSKQGGKHPGECLEGKEYEQEGKASVEQDGAFFAVLLEDAIQDKCGQHGADDADGEKPFRTFLKSHHPIIGDESRGKHSHAKEKAGYPAQAAGIPSDGGKEKARSGKGDAEPEDIQWFLPEWFPCDEEETQGSQKSKSAVEHAIGDGFGESAGAQCHQAGQEGEHANGMRWLPEAFCQWLFQGIPGKMEEKEAA